MPASHPDLHSLDAYDFALPADLIAQAPVHPRDASRLLHVNRARGEITHHRFTDLPQLLRPTDLLVANNTQVIRARLLGQRRVPLGDGRYERGGKVEFLMLEERGPRRWEGMFHASAKHKPGVEFEIPTPDGHGLRGKLVRGASDSPQGTVEAEFDRDPIASGAGELPLPPYIERKPGVSDDERYQTIYAKSAGSAAAPTAGLHFTPAVQTALRARGIGWSEVTLHVGLGTFRPVKTLNIQAHAMHEERYEVSPETAMRVNETRARGDRVVAVGTTSVRTLESAAQAGGVVKPGSARTSIFIYPGSHPWQTVDAMITNFHLPKSTLLMMVAAFADYDLIMRAYAEAVRERYRFFSYGDAMLID